MPEKRKARKKGQKLVKWSTRNKLGIPPTSESTKLRFVGE
jgi:hypothetical protein